ncbi:MAG: ABC transporter ATP-binding protein [Micrococcaceae bacterium]
MSKDTVLSVNGLNVHYGRGIKRTQVLFDVDLQVARGEAVGIVGETGSGKTTLAHAILGLVSPSSGEVFLGPRSIAGLRGRELRALRQEGTLGFVFQDPLRSLDPDRTIEESVGEPLDIASRGARSTRRQRVVDVLAQVDLGEEFLERLPHQLSGGQRQRASIARTLISSPQIIILDEPVSALDAPNRVKVLQILTDLREQGVSLVFISHDLGSVAGLTDRTVVLYRGRIMEEGATEEIINRPSNPYTRLLVGSAPLMFGESLSAHERKNLRLEVGTRT